MPEEKSYYNVYMHGTYYCPAYKKYNQVIEVGCDRCLKNDISVCISFGKIDLCLECVVEINDKYDSDNLSVYSDN
jgi:hypothetical protein